MTVWQWCKLDAQGAGLVENETSLARSAAGTSRARLCAVGCCFAGGMGWRNGAGEAVTLVAAQVDQQPWGTLA